MSAAKAATHLPVPIRNNPSLKQCVEAFWTQIEAQLAGGATTVQTLKAAATAYKLHLPEMRDMAGIRAYVDAVANGVCLGALDGKEASTLLYAAQIAISAAHKHGPTRRK